MLPEGREAAPRGRRGEFARADVAAGHHVVFGTLFVRWRRTNPMIIAHTLINAVAFIGYTFLVGHVSWLP